MKRRAMLGDNKFDYIQDGLVLWFDGVWNNGIGKHNDNATVWKDLSGNNADAILGGALPAGAWTEDSFNFELTNSYFTVPQNKIPSSYPYGANDYTIEYCWKSMPYDMSIFESGVMKRLNALACVNLYSNGSFMYRNYWYDSDFDFNQPYESKKQYYGVSFNGQIQTGYIDAEVKATYSHTGKNTSQNNIYIGGGPEHPQWPMRTNLYSLRVYNRCLSANEIQQNYLIDKKRFNL
ncbi:hypothetical protein [Parabacteroides provencensis]|uniref:hypothetical protein n=1 Tax=Parabacteroides provencensis TaxID=1944636 RepID=UPI000C146F38|nr:hypothetical protein [Parabacteroides provencensis]